MSNVSIPFLRPRPGSGKQVMITNKRMGKDDGQGEGREKKKNAYSKGE